MVVGFGGPQQIGSDRHGGRRADQAQPGHLGRVARSGLQRNQRTHGMTDQPCRRRTRRIEQRRGPVGHVGDGGQWRAA